MVFKPVAHVEVAEHLRVGAVVSNGTWPHTGSQHGEALSHVSGDGPHVFCGAAVGC